MFLCFLLNYKKIKISFITRKGLKSKEFDQNTENQLFIDNHKQMPIKSSGYHVKAIGQLRRYSSLHSLEMKNSIFLGSSTANKNNPELSKRKQTFIPFCQERDLGNLIDSKIKNPSLLKNKSVQKMINYVNFKNFKKIYNRQKGIQVKSYAKLTRLNDQIDILKQQEWIVNDLRRKVKSMNTSKLSLQNSDIKNPLKSKILSKYPNNQPQLRKCCSSRTFLNTKHNSSIISSKNSQFLNSSSSLSQFQKVHKQNKNKFQKIDIQLYKKLAVEGPPHQNSEQLNKLYLHYIQASQLNQNLRRQELTKKRKNTIL